MEITGNGYTVPVLTAKPSGPRLKKQSAGPAEMEIASDLLVWTAGSQPCSVLDSLDVPKDSRRRIMVDRRLRLISGSSSAGGKDGAAAMSPTADVYCLGDIAAVEGLDLACNAQV